LNKKEKVEIHGLPQLEVQGKYVKYVGFIWSSLEAALPILKVILSVKDQIFLRN
jgi:hypothetical protein